MPGPARVKRETEQALVRMRLRRGRKSATPQVAHTALGAVCRVRPFSRSGRNCHFHASGYKGSRIQRDSVGGATPSTSALYTYPRASMLPSVVKMEGRVKPPRGKTNTHTLTTGPWY